MGVGAGGVYPLSAATSAESSVGSEHSGERVGWALFWQTPGSMVRIVCGAREKKKRAVLRKLLLSCNALLYLLTTHLKADSRLVSPTSFVIVYRLPTL